MALIWSRDTPQRGEDECESSKMSRALPVINHEVGRTKSRKFTSAGPPGKTPGLLGKRHVTQFRPNKKLKKEQGWQGSGIVS